jgi:hypothetical protein
MDPLCIITSVFYCQTMTGSPLLNLKRCTHFYSSLQTTCTTYVSKPWGHAAALLVTDTTVLHCDLVAAPVQRHESTVCFLRPQSLKLVDKPTVRAARMSDPNKQSLTARGAQFTVLHPTSCARVTPRSTLWIASASWVMRHGLRLVFGNLE